MYRVVPTSTVSAYSRHRSILFNLGPQTTFTVYVYVAGALPGTQTGMNSSYDTGCGRHSIRGCGSQRGSRPGATLPPDRPAMVGVDVSPLMRGTPWPRLQVLPWLGGWNE